MPILIVPYLGWVLENATKKVFFSSSSKNLNVKKKKKLRCPKERRAFLVKVCRLKRTGVERIESLCAREL